MTGDKETYPADTLIEANVAEDPWSHRVKGMQCHTCMYYVRKVSETTLGAPVGRCRRHAPTMAGYPVVFATDWCGDHKLDENKT